MTKVHGGKRKMLLFTGGILGIFMSKTATSLARYCGDEVVGVLDAKHAGRRLEEIIGCGEGIPVFGTFEEAVEKAEPNVFVVGVAPVGGGLSAEWRADILKALEAGLDVMAGLHAVLSEDEEFARAARESGARIFDVREPPVGLPISQMKALDSRAFRVLTVGSDCSSGKMVTALELTVLGKDAGLDARFVATGQTGIMIAGRGIAVDRVISDFTAGAAETLVVEDGDAEMLFVEGQGSLTHPGFSGVTLSLVHGSLPHAMVMCHVATREKIAKYERDVPLPGLSEMIERYEDVTRPVFPGKVAGVALNTFGMGEDDAWRAVEDAARETGLPATDCIRFGAGPVFEAVKEMYDEFSRRGAQART